MCDVPSRRVRVLPSTPYTPQKALSIQNIVQRMIRSEYRLAALARDRLSVLFSSSSLCRVRATPRRTRLVAVLFVGFADGRSSHYNPSHRTVSAKFNQQVERNARRRRRRRKEWSTGHPIPRLNPTCGWSVLSPCSPALRLRASPPCARHLPSSRSRPPPHRRDTLRTANHRQEKTIDRAQLEDDRFARLYFTNLHTSRLQCASSRPSRPPSRCELTGGGHIG
jgi:hypothetical protein